MASPIGHALAGVGLAAIVARATGAPSSLALWLGSTVASCLPDLDLIGLAFGFRWHRVHRRATHSLVTLGTLILVAACLGREAVIAPGLYVAWAVALLSHPIIDVLTTGPQTAYAGYGIPLFWPVAPRRWYVRRPLVRSFSLSASMLSGQVWRALVPELVFFGSASIALIVLSFLV